MLFHYKSVIVFADYIGLTIKSNLVPNKHILHFSKAEGSIILKRRKG